MKRYLCIAMALVLMASLFVGCGCQNVSERKDGRITEPTNLLPTITTEPTHATTRPTVETHPSTGTHPTIETRDPMHETTGSTGATDATNGSAPSDMPRARNRMDGRS